MTPVQLRAFDFIRDQIAEAGCAPSYDELLAELRVTSRSSVARIIDALVDQGKLQRDRSKARGLSLPAQPDIRDVPTSALKAELARRGETLDGLARPTSLFGHRTCAARRCPRTVTPGKLFCWDHWTRLPLERREAILTAWGRHDMPAYTVAVTAALDALDPMVTA